MHRFIAPLAIVSAALVLAPVAGAQEHRSPFAAWIGCWEPVPRGNAPVSGDRVCVLPTDDAAVVELVSVAGDSVMARQRLEAADDERAMQQGDCRGV
ncbi:MAG TPA: hypothetical protein VFV33_22045, partial [Gemmatimonadaceae bacterium]|nr:hypothetical protein [Gemmatimonadaceae bacterium]